MLRGIIREAYFYSLYHKKATNFFINFSHTSWTFEYFLLFFGITRKMFEIFYSNLNLIKKLYYVKFMFLKYFNIPLLFLDVLQIPVLLCNNFCATYFVHYNRWQNHTSPTDTLHESVKRISEHGRNILRSVKTILSLWKKDSLE